MKIVEADFIPATMERQIAPSIVFRPIRSWSSLTYAGERLTIHDGDRSGCLDEFGRCAAPMTVTHRNYWNTETKQNISAFLSYPNAMGVWDRYFWEIYPAENGDIERFESETEMETRIISILTGER